MTPLLIIALLLGSAAPAPEDAEGLLSKGVAQFEAGEFASSQATLQRAIASAAPGAIKARAHLHRGFALASLEKVPAAEAEFVAALREDPLVEVDASRVKERLVRLFRQSREKLTGVLEISADHEAAVRVDDVASGSAPLRQSLRVGRHVVEAQSPDGAWRSERTEAVVPVDGKLSLALRMSPVLGSLRLTSSPSGARVSVDGVERGQTPLELQLPVGKHELRLLSPTGDAWQESVPITEGAVTVRSAAFATPPLEVAPAPAAPIAGVGAVHGSVLRPTGIALTAVGGAALAAAGIFALLGDQENRAIRKGGFARPEDIQAAANRGDTYNVAGFACLGAGAPVLGTGVVLLIVGGRSPSHVALVPVVRQEGVGVALSGVLP